MEYGYLQQYGISPFVVFIVLIWSLFWKGVALWHAAARNHQRNWFIAMLVLNFFGLIEILYLFVFSKKKFTFSMLRPS